MRNHSIVIKPRRRFGIRLALVLIFAIVICMLLGFSLFMPARLALAQERVLGLLHNGIAESAERSYVDACVRIEGDDNTYAVTRTVRTITYRDGTSLSVVFSSSPTPTIAQCSG
jgi:hypothetical protein